MKNKVLLLSILLTSAIGVMAEKMEKCEPSLYMAVGAGATKLDGKWASEANMETDFGVMFRTGHALYVGFQFNKMSRTPYRDPRDNQTVDKDKRQSRTNFPVYLMYQYRLFGWHKGCEDKHRVSPYAGAKFGWNFLQDTFIGETVAQQNLDERKNNWFGTPLIGFDYRCAEYFTLGLVLECELSRRYREDVDGNLDGSIAHPRACLVFRF